jgi:leucyl aminopeptidase (aminopeptidase T)
VAGAAATDAISANQPDWPKVARLITERSLRLAPGERVIIHYMPGRYPGLVDALRKQIITSGGVICAELTWPTQDLSNYFESLSPQQKTRLAESQNTVYREIFARSDVYLWLDVPVTDDLISRQFEHLIAESGVRAIHFHLLGAPDPKTNPQLWQMYEKAIEMDSGQLKALEDSLATKLRGATVHLTSLAGTDLTFKVTGDAWFHENTGDASKEKARNPLSTRDREEEIPSGDIRTTGVTAANGKLVAIVNGEDKTDTATLTFRDGRLVRVEPMGKNADAFAKWYNETSGDKDRIGELVIGNNPYLVPVAEADAHSDFGYAAGTVRLDVGENWEAGGPLRTGNHEQWAFIVPDGTLKIGRKALIEHGKPVP